MLHYPHMSRIAQSRIWGSVWLRVKEKLPSGWFSEVSMGPKFGFQESDGLAMLLIENNKLTKFDISSSENIILEL